MDLIKKIVSYFFYQTVFLMQVGVYNTCCSTYVLNWKFLFYFVIIITIYVYYIDTYND